MYRWKVVAVVCCLSWWIVGCEDPALVAAKNAEAEAQKDKAQAQKTVSESLKDPDSAKFGETSFVIFPKGDSVMKLFCVTVNARNSFGGYVGYHQVMVSNEVNKTKGSIWEVVSDVDLDGLGHERCKAVLVARSK